MLLNLFYRFGKIPFPNYFFTWTINKKMNSIVIKEEI